MSVFDTEIDKVVKVLHIHTRKFEYFEYKCICLDRGVRELMNHQLHRAETGVTDESISDWISGLQDTFSSTQNFVKQPHLQRSKSPDKSFIYFGTPFRFNGNISISFTLF